MSALCRPRPLRAYLGATLQVAAENPGCGLGWNPLAGIGRSSPTTEGWAALESATLSPPDATSVPPGPPHRPAGLDHRHRRVQDAVEYTNRVATAATSYANAPG